MSDNRYSELKYDGQTYTEQWKIDEILIKNKFNWMVNAEIKNARLEIFQDTLVWNAGIWYNGDWYFGVWRDGEWRYGTWQNGVFYNGIWRNGTFKSGIIYNGKFFRGKMISGEIRGGQFVDFEIAPAVVEFTDDEFQAKQEEQTIQQNQTNIQPTTDPNQVKVRSSQPAGEVIYTQPKIQQESMKHLKKFESFSNTLTPELLQSLIDDIFKENSIDKIPIEMMKIKKKYTEIGNNKDLKNIYLNAANIWRKTKNDEIN